jgi:hypothetical protein
MHPFVYILVAFEANALRKKKKIHKQHQPRNDHPIITILAISILLGIGICLIGGFVVLVLPH